jgi:hypothetical protein
VNKPKLTNHLVLTFAILAAFDMAMNAAAGASAATVGAHLNGKSATAQIIRLGALAGFTKAAITSFREVVLWANINFVFGILLMIIFTSWGICLIVTAEICNLTLTTSKFYLSLEHENGVVGDLRNIDEELMFEKLQRSC